VVFSGTLVSSTNKTDNHDITEKLLNVALNTIKNNINYLQIMSSDEISPNQGLVEEEVKWSRDLHFATIILITDASI
jgi:hypothetical protein